MVDDRAAFFEEQRAIAERIRMDDELQALALETKIASDRQDYSYVWTWLGVPIIQVPTDVVVMQEIIWETQPDLIIETGVARGGSLVFYASMLQLLGRGQVVGIDIDIRGHNRDTVESHPLSHRVRFIEGSSVDSAVLRAVGDHAEQAERVMVVLDSNHTHDHVLAELEGYSRLVSSGQFLIVADTVVEYLPRQEHRPRPWGPGNNPLTAVEEFLRRTDQFVPDPYYNGKLILTSSPGGYLRRVK